MKKTNRVFGWLALMSLTALMGSHAFAATPFSVIEQQLFRKVQEQGAVMLRKTSVILEGIPSLCPNGGMMHEIGIDEDNNGVLDKNEIWAGQPVCNP